MICDFEEDIYYMTYVMRLCAFCVAGIQGKFHYMLFVLVFVE